MRIQLKPGIVATVLANADPGKLSSRSQSAIMKNSPQLDSREPHANTGFSSEKGVSEIGSLFHCFSVCAGRCGRSRCYNRVAKRVYDVLMRQNEAYLRNDKLSL